MTKLILIAAAVVAMAGGAAAGGPTATMRLAPRQEAATPTLFLSDGAFVRRDGVDRSMFGARPDTPMPIPATGERTYMVLSFFQYHPGRDWRCETFFSFVPRQGGAYRVTHAHRFEESCSAEVVDLATGATDATFRTEPAPIPGLAISRR